MLPTRIELRDFTSYVDQRVELDGIHIAALVGPNGAGKSSLLDAITWALWGEATKGGVKALDNYVRRGEAEASVAVEFSLHGQAYRVERIRSAAKQKTSLRLLQRSGDGWVEIGGKSVTETQEAIDKLLRMDYRTFTASSLILQGRSDSLTADMTDAERKEVLARILGLDLWDRLLEAARERARDARAKVGALNTRLAPVEAEAGRRAGIEADITTRESELSEIAHWLEVHEHEVAENRAKIQQKPLLEQRLREIDADLGRKRREQQEAGQEFLAAEAAISQHQQILGRRAEILAAAEAVAAMQADVRDFDAKAQQVMAMGRQVESAAAELSQVEREIEGKRARLRAVIENADKQAGLLGGVPCAGSALQESCRLLAGARQAVTDATRARAELQALDADTRVSVLRERRDRIVAERQAVGYDPEGHRAAREALQEAEAVARLKPQLVAADERVREQTERASTAKARGAVASEEIIRLEVERRGITESLDRLAGSADAVAASERAIADLRRQEATVREAVGRLRQSLEASIAAAAEVERIRADVRVAQAETQVYDILVDACSKKGGVPALIVENAVPEIERLVNQLLARMAGGRLQVRLATQEETKTTGTMSEVLRIVVYDQGVEGPYQTYSGAERFMVDLALRIALSKFLAHRAGAEIQLLVLDEGLGALDGTNRHQVVEAIQEAGRDFGRVLVITHIGELQDAFPQRIEVCRNETGSQVTVLA